VREWTVSTLHEAFLRGETSPDKVCQAYLQRIEELDQQGPALNAVIERNPDAVAMARTCTDRLTQWRAQHTGKWRAQHTGTGETLPPEWGRLFGVPVLLKDNIDTADRMQTTAGSIALLDAPTPSDAELVRRLREAGAVILGKTNLSEWANFRSTRSSSGWSSRGGQTRNPYALDRTPCGSSSGSAAAIAANLAVLAVGTETDGSVTCPAAHTSLVGLKPTVGSISRGGIIPISASQDTAGPMARTVSDAAILFQVMAGADREDPADRGTLQGVRIGVARAQSAVHPAVEQPFEEALRTLQAAGAVLVDPTDLPDLAKAAEHELVVLRYEFKHGLEAYLQQRGGSSTPSEARKEARSEDRPEARGGHGGKHRGTPKTLEDIIAFNRAHADRVMPHFGQEHMEAAAACGPLTDERYKTALRESRRTAGRDGIEALFRAHELDAIVAPTNAPAWLIDHVNGDCYSGGEMATAPAISGAPHITVPMGYYRGLPLGISFVAELEQDAKLLRIAAAFESAHPVREAPRFRQTADLRAPAG
jgi:amidase